MQEKDIHEWFDSEDCFSISDGSVCSLSEPEIDADPDFIQVTRRRSSLGDLVPYNVKQSRIGQVLAAGHASKYVPENMKRSRFAQTRFGRAVFNQNVTKVQLTNPPVPKIPSVQVDERRRSTGTTQPRRRSSVASDYSEPCLRRHPVEDFSAPRAITKCKRSPRPRLSNEKKNLGKHEDRRCALVCLRINSKSRFGRMLKDHDVQMPEYMQNSWLGRALRDGKAPPISSIGKALARTNTTATAQPNPSLSSV